jgi:hypothetical protein
MKVLMGRVLLALVIAGCSTMPPKHEFDYDDVGLLKKCFAEVVRKSYGARDDGDLSAAATGLRFVFHYNKPVDGAHSEMVDLVLGRMPIDAAAPTSPRHVFNVVVHRSKLGRDPVLSEESAQLVAEIKAMMASQGGASPSRP